jgi:hypothetical protein
LGRVLYRLLAGSDLPAATATIPSLHDVRPDVTPALDAYLARMLAANTADRPTMAEVAAALKSIDTLPEPAGAVAPFEFADEPAAEPSPAPATVDMPEIITLSTAADDSEPIIDLEPDAAVDDEPVVNIVVADEPDAEAFAINPVSSSAPKSLTPGPSPARGEARPKDAAAAQPIGEFAIAFDTAPASTSTFAVSAPTTTATPTASARKPAKRGKQQPLPLGIPEKYAKYLAPKYLMAGGGGLIFFLILLVWLVAGGRRGPGGAGPEQVEKVRAIPPRTAPAPATPATVGGPTPSPTANPFNLPVKEAFPTGKRAK